MPATDGDASTVKGMLEELKRRGGTVVGEAAERPAKMGYVPVVPEHRESAAGPREVHLGWSGRARPDQGKSTSRFGLPRQVASTMRWQQPKRLSALPVAPPLEAGAES